MFWLALLACYPGRLEYPGGEDKLRTALHIPLGSDHYLSGGYPTAAVLLSNSQFICPDDLSDEPGEVSQQISESGAVFFREDARTLLLMLRHPEEGDGLGGEYPVYPLDASPVEDRWASVFYIEVTESVLNSSEDQAYSYELADYQALTASAGGSVEVEQEETELSGTFDIQSLELEGRWRSQNCQMDNFTLTAALAQFYEDYFDYLAGD